MIELQLLNTALLKDYVVYDLMKFGREIFTDEKNKILYDLIEKIYLDGKTPDLTLLISEIKKNDLQNDIDCNKLVEKISSLPTTINHIEIIKNLEYEKRKKQIKLHSFDLLNKKINIDQFIDCCQPLFENEFIEDDGTDICDYVSGDLDKIFNKGLFVETGIPELDSQILGLFRGDLTIIAARPGMGKTTLALQIAKTIKGNVQYFSFEMKKPQILAKYISAETDIQVGKILENNLSDNERKKVFNKIPEIAKYDITVFDDGDSFPAVLSQMKKTIRKKKSSAIIVDYLQLISGSKGHNKNDKIEFMSRQFKKLAMNENIPIILLSQLNREIEKQNREPMLSDLRDSGAIEQDATIVMFLHNDSIIVAKNRIGHTGKVNGIFFEKEYSRFVTQTIRTNFEDTKVFGY
jgi:replicative DNA helicase